MSLSPAILGVLGLLFGLLVLIRAGHDRSERDEAVLALSRSEDARRRLFESSRDALVVLSVTGGQALAANSAAIRLYRGRDEADLLSRFRLEALLGGRLDRGRSLAGAGSGRADAVAFDGADAEAWCGRLDGAPFPAMVRLSEFEWGGSETILAVVHDLTDVRELESRLEQAQRLEAVGRFAAGVAHDFNNLLTVIDGLASLCLDEAGGNAHVRAHLLHIRQAEARAATMTRQLLTFSRGQHTNPAVLDVNASILEMDWMVRRLVGAETGLITSLTPDDARITMCPGQFEQVLMNLVANARDAMPEGGAIRIETALVGLPESAEDPRSAVVASRVRISVTDEGTGISAETMPRLFEPHFTTKEQGKGTGLGLATVAAIVERAGGGIRVTSEPGRTTFSVDLPRTEPRCVDEAGSHRSRALPSEGPSAAA